MHDRAVAGHRAGHRRGAHRVPAGVLDRAPDDRRASCWTSTIDDASVDRVHRGHPGRRDHRRDHLLLARHRRGSSSASWWACSARRRRRRRLPVRLVRDHRLDADRDRRLGRQGRSSTGPLRNLWVVAIALILWSAVMVFAEQVGRRRPGRERPATCGDAVVDRRDPGGRADPRRVPLRRHDQRRPAA